MAKKDKSKKSTLEKSQSKKSPVQQRRSFTLKYKLAVLNHLAQNGDNLHKTAKQFKVQRSCIRKWKAKKSQFQNTRSKC
jgi:transposase-like protein